ncbi:MAG: HD domain-containing protein [Acidobacteria bacterium]|nr:HD domain-containing protein [Acidobacteriota bacterium]
MSPGLREISETLREDGYAFLVVGESARRLYSGERPSTLQVWTNADLLYLARRFDARPLGGTGEEAGASVPALPRVAEDASVSLDAGGCLLKVESDPLLPGVLGKIPLARLKPVAVRRPFTADALLFDPGRSRFLDPSGCLTDIRGKRLRLLAPPAANPLRNLPALFRAVRMEVEEGFTPDPALLEALRGMALPLDRPALPHYRLGLLDVLTGSSPQAGLARLDDLGVLGRVIPEMEDLKGCPQDKDYHPEGDVFTHTLECFRRVRKASPALGLSLLLHDVAKPLTLAMNKRNLHFPGHSTRGAEVAGQVLRRLGFDRALIEEVKFCIRNHLLPVVVYKLSEEEVVRLVRHPAFPTLLRLYREDVRGSMGDLASYRDLVRRIAPYRPVTPSTEEDE